MNKNEDICWQNQKTVHFCLSQRHKIVIMPKNAFGFSVKCVNVIFCIVCFSKDVVDHALHSQMMFFKRKHRGLSLRPIQTPFTGSVHGQKEQILGRTIFSCTPFKVTPTIHGETLKHFDQKVKQKFSLVKGEAFRGSIQHFASF